MKLQPIPLFPLPPAIGTSGTSGLQAVGGFSELLGQQGESGLSDWLMAQVKSPSNELKPTVNPDSSEWLQALSTGSNADLLVAAIEDEQVPVALATGIPRDAFSYGGEPQEITLDLLQQQPSALAGAPDVTPTALPSDGNRPETISPTVTSMATAAMSSRDTASRPDDYNPMPDQSRLDLAKEDSQEAIGKTPNASSQTAGTQSALRTGEGIPTVNRDEVLTRSPLRSPHSTSRQDAFQRPAHEPAPRVEVKTALPAQAQLASQAKNLASAADQLRTRRDEYQKDSSAPSKSGGETEETTTNPVRYQANSTSQVTRIRPGEQRLADATTDLEVSSSSQKNEEMSDSTEVDLEAMIGSRTEFITPETYIPPATDILVDVDEDLAVKINTAGREVSVAVEGSSSALSDLQGLGPELAESLERMGFELSNFNAEERSESAQSDTEGQRQDANGDRTESEQSEEASRPRFRRGHRVDITA